MAKSLQALRDFFTKPTRPATRQTFKTQSKVKPQ